MTTVKITEDILLKELFKLIPESKELLKPYGFLKIEKLNIEDVVTDKLSLKGFLKLMGYGEGTVGAVLKDIQILYNKKLEEV